MCCSSTSICIYEIASPSTLGHKRNVIKAPLLENKRTDLHELHINSSLTSCIVNILPLGNRRGFCTRLDIGY